MVVPTISTWNILLLASTRPFLIASATSFALPYPYPTLPFPSPMTSRAENDIFLPPLVTLATRFMLNTFSLNCFSCLLCSANFLLLYYFLQPFRTRPFLNRIRKVCPLGLKFKPGFPRGIGQSLDPSVIKIPAPVKDRFLYTFRLRCLGDHLSQDFRGLNVSA